MANVNQETLQRIRKDQKLRFAIAQGLNRSMGSIERWVRKSDPMLASEAVILILQRETGLFKEQMIEKESQVKQSAVA